MTETMMESVVLRGRRDTYELPPLDVDLLLDLIQWADEDQRNLRSGKFFSWGSWNQEVWASVKNKSDETLMIGEDFFTDEEQKEILNGVCETAFCMAGQAVMQKGYRLYGLTGRLFGGDYEHVGSCVKQEWTGEFDDKGRRIMRDVPNSGSEDISIAARRELGLHEVESTLFFDGDNQIPRLKALANVFMEARNLPAMFPDYEPNDDEGTLGLDLAAVYR